MKRAWILSLLLVACATNNPEREVAVTAGAPESLAQPSVSIPESHEPIVAHVGESEVLLTEFLSTWLYSASGEVRGLLEVLVTSHQAQLEARRMGLMLDEEVVVVRTAAAVAEIESKIHESRPDTSLPEWVAGELGLSPERYVDNLRRDVRERLILERVVRAFMLGHERARVRVIVVESAEEIEAVARELQGGADFATLAKTRSKDVSKKDGGRITPVLRGPTPLAKLAFETPVGTFGGPLEEDGRWLMISVEALEPALTGEWAVIGAPVEQSLREEGLAEPEYWQWKNAMAERHTVDLGPFFELVGEE